MGRCVRSSRKQAMKRENKSSSSMILGQCAGRVIHSLTAPALAEPFRSAMNNYWMTNNAMELTTSRRTTLLS